MKSLLRCVTSGLIWCAVLCAPNGVAAADQPPYWFGAFETEVRGLGNPTDVAVSADGAIFVLESGRGCVRTISRDGEALAQWGEVGSEAGQFLAPRSFSLHGDRVFITDSGNHRVQVFRRDGTPLRAWGGLGRSDGQFNEPGGIAVTSERVYVTDIGNHRVQVFDHEGRFLHAFGRPGSAAGEFRSAVDVAVSADGEVFVLDADNCRVQAFDADGRFQTMWGEWGPFIGLLDEPSAIVCHGKEVLVVDKRNHRVQSFDRAGSFLGAWGVHELVLREGKGKIHYPSALAVSPEGSFAVVCETAEDRCQIFAAAPPDSQRENAFATVNKNDQTHLGDHLDADGNLLVMADPENHFNLICDASHEVPIILSQFGERGDRFGLIRRVAGFDLDMAKGRILIADPVQQRLQEWRITYDPTGPVRMLPDMASFAGAVDCERLRATVEPPLIWPLEPTALARDGRGNLYMLDARNCRVIVFDEARRFVRSWGREGGGVGEFRRPTDIAVNRDGERVFVVDSLNCRIHQFDADGAVIATWGKRGDRPGEFQDPFGIEIDERGSVYVTDSVRCVVTRFDSNGSLLNEWGGRGDEVGRFWKPRGIAADVQGRLIVVDQGNHRAQGFSADGEWLVTFGLGRAYTPANPPRSNNR